MGEGRKLAVERFAGKFELFDPDMNKLKFTRRGIPNFTARKKVIRIPTILKKRFLFDCLSSLLDNLDPEARFLILCLSSVQL